MAEAWHVISNLKTRWSVRRSGAARATRNFQKEDDALAYAQAMARKDRSILYLHDRDGRIRQRLDFSDEAREPADG